MKRILIKNIIIVSQVVMLLLAILWYFEGFEKEPLIAIIGLVVSITTTIIYQSNNKEDKQSILKVTNIKGRNINIKNRQEKGTSIINEIKGKGNVNIDIEQK